MHTLRTSSGQVYLGAGNSDEGLADPAHLHSSLDSDVAVLSPGRAPGVLDQPVVHSVFVGAVTNHSYGVVGIGYGGVTSGKYSGAVRAEGRGRLSNSNLPCLEKIYYDYM